jgi:DDE superfamily endonuclease
VILDNLSSHKGARVRALIEAAGASLLSLPPDSPDFNPIENAFAKLKALLRKAAERTVEGLWTAIGRRIDVFTPIECANYFAAAEYDPTRAENPVAGSRGQGRALTFQGLQIGDQVFDLIGSRRNSGMVGWPTTMPSAKASARLSTG